MKKLFLVLILLIITLIANVQSQTQIREDISEGTEFWIGLPFSAREANEAIRGDYPIAIWISSKVNTRATIEDAESGSKVNLVIRANQITQVPYGDHVMNKISEVPKNYGIHIVGEGPISVSVYMSYRWTGEAFKVHPVHSLGKKYVSMNMYQDQLLQNGEYRSPQILVVATEDNTKLTYKPRVETAKGIKSGEIGTVNLMKGQTFLILGKVQENKSQDNSTDLTGTYLEATKPIAVVSGHTKAAFPRYQFTFLGRNGGFMRNMMVESLLPIEKLGTEYVSAPLAYADRPRGKITDDKGDLIRFVATEDNTTIWMIKEEGTGLKKISPVLSRGQFYDIVNQESPAYYQSDKPVLAAQYGKTWWIYATSPITKEGDDMPENPSRNGAGMLMTLIPRDRWTSYAVWRSPPEIDDFLYLTFDKKYLNYIYTDGAKIVQKFPESIKYIPGTEYAYIATSIAAGDHFIYGDTIPGTKGVERARFAVYAYGNWDRSKDGFAYGYPVGFNYGNFNCNDSISIIDTMVCGDISAIAKALPSKETCAVLYNIFDADMKNYIFYYDPAFQSGVSNNVSFYLHVDNPKNKASGKIKVLTASGLYKEKSYNYEPEEIRYEPTVVDFGRLSVGDSVCKTFDIVNSSSTKEAVVHRLYLKDNNPYLSINENSTLYPLSFPFTLKPGERKTVEVCIVKPALSYKQIRENVIAELSCYEWPQVELMYEVGKPVAYIEDALWTNIHVGNLNEKTIRITNTGNLPLELTSISWPDSDKVNFPKIGSLPCGPLGGDFNFNVKIQPNGTYEFHAYYQPSSPGSHQTVLTFKGNTDKDKLYSTLIGTAYTGIDTDLEDIEISNDEIVLRSSGLSDDICITDILGRNIYAESSKSSDATVIDISNLPKGIYLINTGKFVKKFIKH